MILLYEMKNVSYTTLQQKYPGKLVAMLEKEGKVVAFGKTAKELEETLNRKNVDPKLCIFLGPIEQYKQISAY